MHNKSAEYFIIELELNIKYSCICLSNKKHH